MIVMTLEIESAVETTKAVVRTVESNVLNRGRNVVNVVHSEIQTGKRTVSDLKSLRPVAAVVDLTVGTVDNLGNLVKTQAEIFRSWVR